ncbi:glycoside hydrolase family 16 protein [Actinomadura graeca]|uniref:Glycoside hydrolase family 16 protein n=1 Tax=Actinomadura graeca TaxID=2750812 RepID=A0ABX8R1D9_9ACTN|nr:glycoside hydrolase family 16 protein [Actinomadura graeca]QXJ24870.1 glycoside hydrolase family 16 protein [Actinomadura graeca]
MFTAGVLAVGLCAAAAVQDVPAGPAHSTAPAGVLDRPAPAIVVGKPGPGPHKDMQDAEKDRTRGKDRAGGRNRTVPKTAAQRYGWGRPVASEDFRVLDPRDWEIYEGAGNGGLGRRSAEAVGVANGVLKITGDGKGVTGGVAWMRGARKRGRWEARVRVNRACACYNANLLLWPVEGGGGTGPRGGGGEIDYMETYGDRGLRDGTNFFLHYGPEQGSLRLDAHLDIDLRTWHAFAVEWTGSSMTGYVDGRRWFRTGKRAALPPGAMGQAIQLDWFPGLTPTTVKGVSRTADATLEVDWIRMYSLAGR